MMTQRRRGFTLLEILLALSISAMIALAIGVMLSALNAATAVENDTRRSTMQRQVVLAKLEHTVRSSARILVGGADHLVLWRADRNGNSVPELSELVRLSWDEPTGEIRIFMSPDDLDPASDITYAMTDDFDAVSQPLAGTAEFPGSLLIDDVTAWSLVLDDADPKAAKLVRLRVSVNQESGPDTATVIASPHASAG